MIVAFNGELSNGVVIFSIISCSSSRFSSSSRRSYSRVFSDGMSSSSLISSNVRA